MSVRMWKYEESCELRPELCCGCCDLCTLEPEEAEEEEEKDFEKFLKKFLTKEN